MSIKDAVVNAGMAVGNVVSGERDRPDLKGSMDQRIKQRASAVAGDATAKMATSVAAPHVAREVAKRAADSVVGRVAAGLAARPMVAAGAALLAVDAVRDGVRVVKGDMKPSAALEHLGASATGLVGGAGGAWAGALAGTLLIPVPVVGSVVGGLLGSVAGSLAGDQVGRSALRQVLHGGRKGPGNKGQDARKDK